MQLQKNYTQIISYKRQDENEKVEKINNKYDRSRTLDQIQNITKSNEINNYLLIFNTTTGSSKCDYLLLDSQRRQRPYPKVNHINLPRLKDIVHYKTIVVHNSVYIIGGKQYESGNILNVCLSYDPRANIWLKRHAMQISRIRFGVVAFNDGSIYVFGGQNRRNVVIDHCERYDPLSDMWTTIKPLPKPRADHAVCIHDNLIFLSGGVNQNGMAAANNFWAYDYKTDTWTVADNEDSVLPFGLERHCMLSYKNSIYIVGGLTFEYDKESEKAQQKASKCLLSFDMNATTPSVISGKWRTDYSPMFTSRISHSATILGHNLYLIGGIDFTNNITVSRLEYYNLRKSKWYKSFNLGLENISTSEICKVSIPNWNHEFTNNGKSLTDKWVLW